MEGFKDWIKDNETRINNAKSLPYFVRDNSELVKQVIKPTINDLAILIAIPIDTPEKMFAGLQKRYGYMLTLNGNLNVNVVEKYNELMRGFNLEEFFAEFETTISKHGGKINKISISAYPDNIDSNIRGDYKGGEISLIRTFSKLNGKSIVEHDYFVLPDELQRKGIAKDTFRSLYKQYVAADIDIIKVHANIDAGAYCWGRYGFHATKSQAERVLERLEIGEFRNLAKEQFDDYYLTHER